MIAAILQNAVTDVLLGVVTCRKSAVQENNRITQLVQTISSQMTQAEDAAYNHPSVCALYLHFILSFFGVIECALRLVFIVLFLSIWFVVYYIIQCVSCGKNQDMSTSYYLTAFWLYIGILSGLVGNLIMPWAPGLYFWQRGR